MFAFVMAAGAVISSVMEANAEANAAEQQQELLQQQQVQTEIKAHQQSIARSKEIQQVMAAQTARAAAGGISVASPTVQSVARESFYNYQQDQDTAALNLSLAKESYGIRSDMISSKENQGLFNIFSSAFSSIGSLYGK